ncbi:putative HTH-type transcriptional regulator [Jannaschia seosinensis]|uniref:Putative HTH-type transcriptional regulator n=1 Tax=Jannaschia seosinensis TaxID=313367 RepID=A0A0M7BAR3_9RHOB|nr:LexA family transcriptional regulator [Jannaschia seosinensis]CUH39481.1 putative HTH-type transcriptional regulator [Jannaschia seosinensis]
MTEHHTLSDRLRARAQQLGLSPAHVAEMAGVNRSFIYDILRGRSARPGIGKLAEVARVLKVEREWLLHGIGEVEGASPFIEKPDEAFVAIAHASPRPSMGGGAVVAEDHEAPGRPYHFRRSWIKGSLKASPSQLRIIHVEGDSMTPTLLDGDTVLVDLNQRAPNPPGIFVLDDGLGLVAKRLEHIPNSDPPAVRVISDNKHYPEYERTADEIHIVGRIRWFAREI